MLPAIAPIADAITLSGPGHSQYRAVLLMLRMFVPYPYSLCIGNNNEYSQLKLLVKLLGSLWLHLKALLQVAIRCRHRKQTITRNLSQNDAAVKPEVASGVGKTASNVESNEITCRIGNGNIIPACESCCRAAVNLRPRCTETTGSAHIINATVAVNESIAFSQTGPSFDTVTGNGLQ